MTYEIEIGGVRTAVSVTARPGGGYRVAIGDGPARDVAAGALGAAEWWLDDERGRRAVAVHVDGDRVTAQVDGHGLTGEIVDPRDAALHALTGSVEGALRTPMPGAVARVLVKVGDAVHAGQVLVVVEAMKMENEFRSPIDGAVIEVAVTAGTAVDANALLVVVE
ncbi:MAG: biotin/lipoyl-containing protein [Myxococcota bacterium]